MKIVLSMAFSRVKSWDKDYKVWAAFLLGFTLCIFNLSKYVAFLRAVGSSAQAVEGYIIIGSTVYYFAGVFLGTLLLLSDAPFTNTRSPYEIIRVGRKKWLWGQVCYVVFASIVYSLAILLFSIFVCTLSTDMYFSNNWSSGMLMLAEKQPLFAVEEFKLAFPFPEFINSTTPYVAMLLTLFFNSCYTCLICMCILAVNLRVRHNIGWIVAAAIHIAGYVISANGPYMFSQKLSLLCCAMPAYHYTETYNITSLYSTFIFIILICLLVFIINKSASKYEAFK